MDSAACSIWYSLGLSHFFSSSSSSSSPCRNKITNSGRKNYHRLERSHDDPCAQDRASLRLPSYENPMRRSPSPKQLEPSTKSSNLKHSKSSMRFSQSYHRKRNNETRRTPTLKQDSKLHKLMCFKLGVVPDSRAPGELVVWTISWLGERPVAKNSGGLSGREILLTILGLGV